MYIILDSDLTTADLVGAICKTTGYPDRNVATNWNWFRTEYPKEITQSLLGKMKTHEWWGQLPIIKDANKGVAWLRGQGHNIIWVTVPYPPCLGWTNARAEWLDRNFNNIKHNEPLITVSNAQKYHIRADVIIDDMPEIVDEYGSHHPQAKCLTFKSELNSNLNRELVTWEDIMQMRDLWYGGKL